MQPRRRLKRYARTGSAEMVLHRAVDRRDGPDHVVRSLKPDPFDEIARLIQTASKPFPQVLVRRLILRATSHARVTPELADAIDRLNASIKTLAGVIDEIGGGAYYYRRDALDDLARLRILCRVTGV